MRKIRNKALENKAMELGMAAFKAGKKLMAARDDAYMSFIQSDEVKAVYSSLFSTGVLAEAYNKGWTLDNLKDWPLTA